MREKNKIKRAKSINRSGPYVFYVYFYFYTIYIFYFYFFCLFLSRHVTLYCYFFASKKDRERKRDKKKEIRYCSLELINYRYVSSLRAFFSFFELRGNFIKALLVLIPSYVSHVGVVVRMIFICMRKRASNQVRLEKKKLFLDAIL